MRVTDRQHIDALLAAIQGYRRDIFDRQEQIASGKRVNRPSDDPPAYQRIEQFRHALKTANRRRSSVEEGQSRLTVSDGVLDSTGNLLRRAKELAIQQRSDTNTATERKNVAKEVHQLFQQLVSLANTEMNSRSLFAGFETETDAFALDSASSAVSSSNTGGATVSASVASASAMQPHIYEIAFTSSSQFDITDLTTGQLVSSGNTYTSGSAFTFNGLSVTITNGSGPPQTGDRFFVRSEYSYQGDGNSIAVETGDGETVASNVPGSQVFSGPTVNVLTVLQDFHQALVTNDEAGIETAIGQLDSALTQVTNARTDIGARINRLDVVKASLDLLAVNTESLQSNVEDADFAKVASELAALQTQLEASMATLTRQFRTSLLDFLR